MDWYYSKNLNLYVSLVPLKITPDIFEIVKKNNIELEWDDYGNICNIDFDDTKKLVEILEGTILSPIEYWQLYEESIKNNNIDLINSLRSSKFTEFLDRVYLEDGTYIDHPKIIDKYKYEGNKINHISIKGRPGWIKFEDINLKNGEPINVRNKTKDSELFKYWSPDLSVTKIGALFALRGYVTSVAMPSLDLGIPVNSKQPKQMIRICVKEKPKGYLSQEEIKIANDILSRSSLNEINDFIKTDLYEKIKKATDTETYILREKIYSTLGYLRINNNLDNLQIIKYDQFVEYINNLKDSYEEAIKNHKNIVIVVGHRNPDSDTVVSSIFESFRNYLTNKNDDTIYIPYIQAKRMPKEIKVFLTDKICKNLIYQEDINILDLVNKKIVRFIYTDQNYQKEYQKFVISIIDHHLLSNNLNIEDLKLPMLTEMVGSCTSLVIRKFIGQNYYFDQKLNNILYCAMLMDTENRVIHKMTNWDYKIMDIIKRDTDVKDDYRAYSHLMKKLIDEKNPKKLYTRDYKSFWGYGFATVKMIGSFKEGLFLHDNIINKIKMLAQKDNKNNNYYFTLIKLVDYQDDALKINKERIYFVFNDNCSDEIKIKLKELLTKITKVSFSNAKVLENDDYIEIDNVGKQLSRKKIAISIEIMLKCYGQYIYSKEIKKWVSRDFLKVNDTILRYSKEISCDDKKRISDINYIEAKKLLYKLNMQMLNIKEFWLVYHEMLKKKDFDIIESFNGKDFVEFLDTVVIGDNQLIYNPIIENNLISGTIKKIDILSASPGLIHPDEINLKTGLHELVRSPNEYDNKSLWRYWSPPKDKTYVFSRSFIFLLSQTCYDAKTLLHESFGNLGVRPIRLNNLKVDLKIDISDKTISLKYKCEYDDSYIEVYNDNNFIE